MSDKAEEVDYNENLRTNYAKSCKALGVKENESVTKAINPEGDAAAPIVVIATETILGPSGVRALAAGILARGAGHKSPGYKHVKALRLYKSDARDSGCAAIAEVLKNGARDKIELELVELMDAGITSAGCVSLGESLMLGANASLRTLRLDLNPGISDEGVAHLCRGLRSNRNLKVLTLAHCGLTSSAAEILSKEWLASFLCTAEAIDLSGNKLGAEGLTLLSTAALKSKTLKELILVDNAIGGSFLETRNEITNGNNIGGGGGRGSGLGGKVEGGISNKENGSDDFEGSVQAGEMAEKVALSIVTTAKATAIALHALGTALNSTECALARVSLEMNALTPADASILIPYCSPENKKLEMLKVDATLPPEIFASLWRNPPPPKAGKKKGKK
jgi:Ran GTPase-activating protein (RanGAP) involved in mRNA processing and transport